MIKTYEELELQLKEYAVNYAALVKKEAEMNEKLNKIKQDYEEKTKELRYTTETIQGEINAFCTKNKSDFDKVRSKEFQFGTVGFRVNPPKVTLLNRKYNLKTVLELVKRLYKKAYVRVKEDLDKEAILADYAGKKLDDGKLAGVGLKVDQDEQFYIDAKYEELV
ncbi:MAG TPA: host-nuclease inhibitor Gam family protein [Melioribacteraceae bacterium]|nr:host-nuclease inhibitor Gam family protein [Melioribacteraceae bacterium]